MIKFIKNLFKRDKSPIMYPRSITFKCSTFLSKFGIKKKPSSIRTKWVRLMERYEEDKEKGDIASGMDAYYIEKRSKRMESLRVSALTANNKKC